MRLSRTDLLPVLTIMAGGVVGALLTFSPLVLWSHPLRRDAHPHRSEVAVFSVSGRPGGRSSKPRERAVSDRIPSCPRPQEPSRGGPPP